MVACKAALALLFVVAALEPLLVTARLSADVTPSNVTGSGDDYCQPLKPCDKPKTSSAEIESVFGLGLLSRASGKTAQYQYEDVTPADAVDWRTVLTNWTVRDQGTCGKQQVCCSIQCRVVMLPRAGSRTQFGATHTTSRVGEVLCGTLLLVWQVLCFCFSAGNPGMQV